MNEQLRETIETQVREAGLKLTPQRFAVLEYLINTPEHPTADEIGAELNKHFPRASRATIYNTLNSLRDSGLIHEVFVEGYVARYDTNLDEHHHFVCRVCDKLEDIPLSSINGLKGFNLDKGYEVESYEIVLRGVCSTCKNNIKKRAMNKGRKGR
jgi:Fe2+ or Zn2+ uptake regulation protein